MELTSNTRLKRIREYTRSRGASIRETGSWDSQTKSQEEHVEGLMTELEDGR